MQNHPFDSRAVRCVSLIIAALLACGIALPLAAQTAQRPDRAKSAAPRDSASARRPEKKPADTPAGVKKPAARDEKRAQPGSAKDAAAPQKTKEALQAEKEQKLKESEEKTVENIEKTLVFGVHKDRADAIGRILKLRRPENKKRLEPKLVEIIASEINAEVRTKAITVAGELEIKAAVPALITAVGDPSEDMRVAAVYALKRIGDPSCVATLSQKLKEQDLSKNANLTEALLNALGEFKTAALAPWAIEGIKNAKTSAANREYLVIFLGRIEARESKDHLLKLLKDEEEDLRIRSYAANSLARMNIKEAAGDINGIIKTIESYSFAKRKKYYNLYIYCLAALARLGDPAAVPRLVDALRSDNAEVRLKAISLIKEIRDKKTMDILKYKMEHDPSPRVQKAAREALAEIEAEAKKQGAQSTAPDRDGPTTPERKPPAENKPAGKK
ncbi:MAG TPA: HEAT repeat domain-containing protein [Spirochaetota bacterium]|nr:HEAT repeat domain-containing protein [Spirochaetota bacterium]HNT10328.1 HEAT repeat domain-containing protein [Spirochaetota bacterium]HNV46136.1 HEAT repeat domain-containing protein [Spirochaetota bacterium]HPI22946.1 HEAT repeat domain-containing protein [Spirochaetota bacterium]HPU90061.1 HEAT repeat domain-containing protein [Spirochaetota bacterium]